MRREWKPMKVKAVGNVREVVQGRGKFSPPNGAPSFRKPNKDEFL